jgi:PAS domain S-box-containing protein
MWLHIVSDAVITLSYYSIPVVLVYFVRKRQDLYFGGMFLCFAVFILACGTTHALEIWNVWHSQYWLSGGMKALTALASAPTAILLGRLVPVALALPSPSKLKQVNAALEHEVQIRREAEENVKRLNAELEARVAQRTAELNAVNAELLHQMAERKKDWEAAARLAAIVESSEDAIIGKDLDGIVTSWNRGAENIFGYAAAEMIGTPFLRLIPLARRHEEDHILERIRSGEKAEPLETERIAKGGRLVHVSVTVSPIKDASGRVVGASKVARDIGERLRAQQALRESEERLQLVINNLTEGLVIADANGELLHWNPAALEMHGFASLDECRLRLPEFTRIFEISTLDGAVLPLEEWPLQRVFRGERLRDCEVRIRRLGADWERLFSFGGSIVRDAAGQPLAFVTINDITARKQVEQQVRQLNAELEGRVAARTAELAAANKELEAFSYSVSHDLRAPLRAVDGFSQAMIEDYAEQLPEEGQRYLKTIRKGAQRMGALIDDLLAFSRLGRLPVRRQAVNTGEMVRAILEELRGERATRPVEIIAGDLPPSWADPSLLRQVWVNLLSNALKYTGRRESARVEIGCEPRAGENVYFVRDNGAGFDMQYADKLFGVFQRLHRAEDYEGTGVGLALVQRIVQRHGGRIWAEAELNRGATFYFVLGGESQS